MFLGLLDQTLSFTYSDPSINKQKKRKTLISTIDPEKNNLDPDPGSSGSEMNDKLRYKSLYLVVVSVIKGEHAVFIQDPKSRIQIRKKSFRIHNTGHKSLPIPSS
jgi:hypothetical protein